MPWAHGLYNGKWVGFNSTVDDDEIFAPSEQPSLDGSGPSLQVIAFWPGFWAARRALQLNTGIVSGESGAAPPPEESTFQSFLVRIPFKGYGRNPYRFGETLDDSFVAPESDTTPIWMARPRFGPLGRTQFRFNTWEIQNQPFDFEHQGFSAKPQYKALGRSQFRFFLAADDSIVVAPEDFTASFIARARWAGLRKNPYQFGLAVDVDFVAPSFEQNPHLFVRWMRSDYDARRAASRLHTFSPQDEDAPASVIPGEVMVVIPETPGAIRVTVMIEHPTTTRVVIDSPNKVYVVPQDDPTAIPLKVVI